MKHLKKFNESIQDKKVKLPDNLIKKLLKLPEGGMGYQTVDVTLYTGKVLKNRQIVNSMYLLLVGDESIRTDEIVDADIEEKIDIDYIKSVFVDFVDTKSHEFFSRLLYDRKTCEVTIKIPELSDRERYSSKIEAFIKQSDNWTSTLKDIQSCINRVLDEFLTMQYKVSYSSYDKIIITFSVDKNLYLGNNSEKS